MSNYCRIKLVIIPNSEDCVYYGYYNDKKNYRNVGCKLPKRNAV